MSRVWTALGYALALGAVAYAIAQRRSYEARFERLAADVDAADGRAVRFATECGRLRDAAALGGEP